MIIPVLKRPKTRLFLLFFVLRRKKRRTNPLFRAKSHVIKFITLFKSFVILFLWKIHRFKCSKRILHLRCIQQTLTTTKKKQRYHIWKHFVSISFRLELIKFVSFAMTHHGDDDEHGVLLADLICTFNEILMTPMCVMCSVSVLTSKLITMSTLRGIVRIFKKISANGFRWQS